MADYPLKQEAAEVQEIISGAVLSNKATNLSEAEKAQARENIGASPFGQGQQIISHFDTLAELEASIISPVPGHAYSVGVDLPYDLYAYDFLRGVWKNYGAIRALDITARFAQNISIPVSSWENDPYIFADYPYKAQIMLGEVTANDFPVVAFDASDAVGGNFCPIAYTFDGYVEIFARQLPAADIIIPAITFIVQEA